MKPDYQLYNGDCLEVMDKLIEQGVKVDVIITDPPYGTTDCKWDSVIPFDDMWDRVHKIVKSDGVILFFGSEPFSTTVRSGNLKNYKYDWYWVKNSPTGFGFAKYQPMRDVENIMVFKNKINPKYYPQGLKKLDTPKKLNRKNGFQGKIYENGALCGKDYLVEYTGYPKNVLQFKPQREGLHPTQKPIELLEYLIKTYTKEGETVLDFTMGSGSTGVACLNTNRKFIGIELDDNYFKIAKDRIETHDKSLF